MAKTGRLQRQRKAALNHMELEHIIQEFGSAMRLANPAFIAGGQRLTLRMTEVWERYIVWSQKQ